ncbi:MAG: 8-oxo-dGTP diphosphatase MutT [Alphaproteobacteria bacterium]|nr:8-oxo-dGTP diphosphatase MutT [Alphaproteobacteria bacterium SS10]
MTETQTETVALAGSREKPILLVSAAVLVDGDNRVLLARRPQGKHLGGLWEFPGGKLQAGETPEDAVIRELQEELGVHTQAKCLHPLTFASHPYEEFHLMMPLFICRKWGGPAVPKEGQELAWVKPGQLRDYPMPPADAPLISAIQDQLM